VADAAELLGDAEVQADRLGVANVELPIRFRRKARDDTAAELAGRDVARHHGANEVGRRRGSVVGHDHPLSPLVSPIGRRGILGQLDAGRERKA
jgi:hypothetical protein